MNKHKCDDLRARIRGPVFPIVTPFTENGDVDYDSLHHYVGYLVDGGAPVLMVTVGTSRFNLLTQDEMLTLNETVVKASNGRALTIVSGPGPVRGSTRENIEFANHAKSIGADAIIVLYPERWYGDEAVVAFFHDIAENIEIGLVIHANPMQDGYGGFTSIKYLNADLVERIAEKPNVIAVKEESGDRKIFEEILNRLNDRLPIIGAGSAMRRFINDRNLGSFTYLVGIGSFKPRLAVEFYQAVMNKDVKKAEAIAEKFEDPLFEFAAKAGWHPLLKETLYQLDLMPPFERKPFTRINEEDRANLREILAGCGWLP